MADHVLRIVLTFLRAATLLALASMPCAFAQEAATTTQPTTTGSGTTTGSETQAAPAAAATPPAATTLPVTPEVVARQQKVINDLEAKADELERRVDENKDDDARLVDLRIELEDLARQLLQAGVAFRPRITEINARLDSLGAAPAEGQPPEAEIVANERQSLTSEKTQINVLIGEAETTSLRVNQLIGQIGQLRRDLFTSTLSKRYEINYTLFGDVVQEFETEMGKLSRSVGSWFSFVINYKLRSVVLATFFSVAAALVLLLGGRWLIGGLVYRRPDDQDPPYISRLSVAFWSTLLRSGAVGVFLLSTWLLYDYFGVLRGDIGAILRALFAVIALVYFVQRLTRSILSPRLPNWRLVDVEPRPARLLIWLTSATALAMGMDYLLSRVFEVTGARLTLTVGESLAATVIVGLLAVAFASVKPFLNEDGSPKGWPPLLRAILYLLGIATTGAALFGYIGLAKFMAQQIVVTGAIVTLMYIGFLSARAVAEVGAFAETSLGRQLGERFDLGETGFDQLSLLLSILIAGLILLIGIPAILLQWGFQVGDIRSLAYSLASEVKIGTVSFSLIGILTGIVVFILGFFATRWFQGWIDGTVMARGRVDAGVRNSIRTAVGYAGVALAGLVGVSAAGIDLSNLALVAGALSLGIGFGLQNVVANFVSGLILLAERPFKVGDWIVAGAVSGTVKKISVRATEIETFQRQTVIMPNSELINAAVGNWTLRNKLGRIDIKVNLAYGADVKRAHQIMLDIARAHPMVLKNPEPFVLFANFSMTAQEFEVRLFLADITNGNIVQNDVRFAICEAFEEAGIEMPSTPRQAVSLVRPDHEATQDVTTEQVSTPARRRRRKPDPD